MRFSFHRLAFVAATLALGSVMACGEEDIISGEGLFPAPQNPSCDALRTCCQSMKDSTQNQQCIQVVTSNSRTSAGDASCKTALGQYVAAGVCKAPPSGTGGSTGFPGAGGSTSFPGAGGATSFPGGGGTTGTAGSTGTAGMTAMGCGSVTTPSADCNACLVASCCSQAATCTGNPDCGSYLGCWSSSGCAASDFACQGSCVSQFPNGTPSGQALLACLSSSCKTPCGL